MGSANKWEGPPTCGHPDRAHQAKGMCAQCYMRDYDARRSEKRKQERRKHPSDYAPNFRKPPFLPPRMADCHPEKKHAAHGLCAACYRRDLDSKPRATCHPELPHVADGLCARCYAKRRYDANPEVVRKQSREIQGRTRKRLRDELIVAYGSKCACPKCPETNTAFLTLEHVNRTGKAHRKEVGRHAYADLRRRGWPQEGYTLLCWNCNALTRFGKICPHVDEEERES